MKTYFFIISLCCCLNISCKKEKSQHISHNNTYLSFNLLNKADWFLGSWENISENGSLTEKWIVENDSTFYAETYFIKDSDTLFSEKVSLIQIGDDLFYIPIVVGQNNDEMVEFKLTSLSENELIFENQEHDFPKMITYKRVNRDSIFAQISGNGKSQDFPFRRSE